MKNEQVNSDIDAIVLTTTDFIPKKEIENILGIIKISIHQKLNNKAIETELKKKAYKMNADAIIGIQFHQREGFVDDFYTGTAVKLKDKP